MSAEYNTPVFDSAPKSQKRQPDILHALQNSEHRREERLSSLSKQLLNINAFKVHGFTEEITRENFPDISEDYFETSIFHSETNAAKSKFLDAKDTNDPVLKELFLQQAKAIEKQRDERMKAFMEKKYGKLEPNKPVDIIKPMLPPQKKPDDHMYL